MKPIKTLILLFLLAGCNPVMHSEYEFVPPASKAGQRCTDKCMVNHNNCMKTCDLEQMTCLARKKQEARDDEFSYVTIRQPGMTPVTVTHSAPNRDFQCDPAACKAKCTEDRQYCHKDCGGEVLVHSYCTAFCN